MLAHSRFNINAVIMHLSCHLVVLIHCIHRTNKLTALSATRQAFLHKDHCIKLIESQNVIYC